ncbi:hypothetical protein EVAR_25872_1 [Eumeta japonica]|uniref:Uncharacterized protein n=1 Tax=Eumeta variegata TaxID=151549 RepID=A0A4C1X8W4_EUMVA|nr:hypothetical protein EVAR_25872_1 [Eumeta japonica]
MSVGMYAYVCVRVCVCMRVCVSLRVAEHPAGALRVSLTERRSARTGKGGEEHPAEMTRKLHWSKKPLHQKRHRVQPRVQNLGSNLYVKEVKESAIGKLQSISELALRRGEFHLSLGRVFKFQLKLNRMAVGIFSTRDILEHFEVSEKLDVIQKAVENRSAPQPINYTKEAAKPKKRETATAWKLDSAYT